MKEGIHPKYEQTTIRCACGAVIETGSTKKDITVEICSKSPVGRDRGLFFFILFYGLLRCPSRRSP